jgi:hypothetical protein
MEIRPQSAFIAFRAYCPLQTLLLSDLVRCGSLLQIVMYAWHLFLIFEVHQTAIMVCIGLPHPTRKFIFL